MTDEQPPVVDSSWKPPMTGNRQTAYVAAIWAAVVLVIITVLTVTPVVTVVSGTPKPVAERTISSAPSPPPAPAPTVTVTAAPPPPAPTAAVALPNEPPPNSDCSGAVIGHSDVKHPQLGMVRVFLFLDKSQSLGPHAAGCALPVTHTGRVLSAIWIDAFVGNGFGFASPATDATGNTFIEYQSATTAYGSGLTVLIPSTDGFENVIDWVQMLPNGHTYFTGVNNYYGAELIGPADGVYTIRQTYNTCEPDCAEGRLIVRNLHWDGRSYVPVQEGG